MTGTNTPIPKRNETGAMVLLCIGVSTLVSFVFYGSGITKHLSVTEQALLIILNATVHSCSFLVLINQFRK